jgi:hypothetical protein
MTLSWVNAGRKDLIRPVCIGVLAAGLLSLFPLQRSIDHDRAGAESEREEILFLPSGSALHRLSGGYSGLLADIYWTRAVQYYGRRRLAHAKDFALLGALLNITTELDPNLLIAYRFGSLFLAGRPPEGAGRPDLAIYLLHRGIVANPTYWRLWEDVGFIYYWDLKDYTHAALAFRTGSEQPGALPWMRVLAASVAAQGGELTTSYVLWSEIARTAGNEAMRRAAENHLAALDAQLALNNLNRLLATYRQQQGREARSIPDLIAAGYLRGFSLDPSGEPFIIGPDGRASLGPKSKINLALLQ